MSLKGVVATLVKESGLIGKEREVRLDHGLIIAVCVDPIYTRLRLLRNSGKPSATEWRTVIDAWPYPVPSTVGYGEVVEAGHDVLCATWFTPVRLIDA